MDSTKVKMELDDAQMKDEKVENLRQEVEKGLSLDGGAGKQKRKGKAPRRKRVSAKENLAIKMAQRWWRRSISNRMTTKSIMKDFKEKGVKVSEMGKIQFDDMAVKLRNEELLKVMEKVVNRVFYISYGRKNTRKIAEVSPPLPFAFSLEKSLTLFFRSRISTSGSSSPLT
jgi:hypothetical protein